MFKMNRILVPVDFSACSRGALEYSANLAQQFGATLHVLHVWEPPRYIIPEVLVQVPGEPSQTLADFARSEAGKEMEKFLIDLQSDAFEVKGRLESGDPTDTILRLAADDDYHLIVMGTHGRTGLSHLFLGSVAEKVVRRAACPVLTIRS
jgi:universal stress protein A